MLIGYARVSTADQTLALQQDALRQAGCDQYYRFSTFEQAKDDFLGSVWKSRSPSDSLTYALVKRETAGGND